MMAVDRVSIGSRGRLQSVIPDCSSGVLLLPALARHPPRAALRGNDRDRSSPWLTPGWTKLEVVIPIGFAGGPSNLL